VNSPGGLNVGGVYYDVSLDAGDALRESRKVTGMLRSLGDEGDRLRMRMTAVAAAVSAAISAIAVEGLTSKLIAAQRQFDVMFASLKTVTGGANNASMAFDRLREFAASTPYSVEQAVQAFVKLKALGLDPSERALTSFGNTSAAMGKSLTQMIEAVADASTSEFERLKEFGIKARVEGDKVTFTFRGVATTVRNSSDEITEYLTRIGEVEFAGAMSERMKTLDGDISNLQDTMQALFLTISQSGFGDAVAAGVRKATEAIAELNASVQEGGLTDYFDRLRPILAASELAVVALAGAVAGRLVASFIAAAAQALTAASAMGAATVATRAFSAVLATLGGPIGIAITGLALLALNWDKIAGSAKSAADVSEGAADRIEAALARGGKAATRQLNDQLGEAKRTLADIDDAIVNLGAQASPEDMGTSAILPDLARLNADRDKVLDTIRQIETAITNAYGSGRRPANEGGGGLRSRTTGGGPPPATTPGARGESEAEIRARQDLARIARVDAAEEEADRRARDRIAERAREEEAASQQRDRGRQFAAGIIGEADPIVRLQQELEAKSALLVQYAALDEKNLALYAQAKVALERDTAARITSILQQEQLDRMAAQSQLIGATGNLFGSMAALAKQFAGEQSGTFRALFAISKGFAIADAGLKLNMAIMQALADPTSFTPAQKLANYAAIASAGGALISSIAGINFGGGRQYGGPVSAGSMYRVNETGAPEMFVGSGGRQYMLPTQGGQVVPADEVSGGGGAVHVVVNNYSGEPVQVRQGVSPREVEIIVGRAAAEVGRQFSSNEGPAFAGLIAGTNARSKL
jgi:hypothetical protein